MNILGINIYRGRNIYCHRPVIKLTLDLEGYSDIPTKDIPDFNAKLLALLPGLKEHYCSAGKPGGFVKRLYDGTYLAHVAEHVILELQHMVGYDVRYGKARCIEGEKYYIVYEYMLEDCGLRSGKLAVDLLNKLLKGECIDLDNKISDLRKVIAEFDLGPSTKAIVDEAKRRGIPVTRIGNSSILRLGYGKYQKLIEGTITENTSCIAVDISCDKQLTKKILREYGIPVPEGYEVYSEDDAVSIARELGYPVVVKPLSGNQGKGVCLNLASDEDVRVAYRIAKGYSENIIVERHVQGRHYRVLVVKDKVAAVSERIPAHVIGDGKSSIKQLIDKLNEDPNRGEGHEKPLTKIKIDPIVLMVLNRQGKDLNYVPQSGEKIYLRDNDNLSTGGIAVDCTDKIHPDNVAIAIRAAQAIGLDIAGVDITAPDISKPLTVTGGVVIEVNASPGIRMHYFPQKGESRDVAKSIIDMLYPYGSKSTIPIVAVTGTNGKTTTTRMIAHILSAYGYTVGMTTTDGIYVDNKLILKGDNTGPLSAATVLADKNIDAAVLETARGGIIRAGLGYDLSDVGIITNVTEDHLGLDGIETLEDMAFVKSLVVEAVKEDGYAVLNADDSMTGYIESRVKCKKVYFSMNENNLLIKKHILSGGTAVYLKDDMIMVANRDSIVPVIDIKDIPATLNGSVRFNVQNSLAATAGCWALRIPIKDISKGLSTFYCDQKHNPGRFNIFNIGNYRVLVDYGHNIDGYKAVIEAATKMGADRLVGIIGVPGDRTDDSIRQIGEICGKAFDVIYIKEDQDLRGRKPGVVANILRKGVETTGFGKEIKIVLSESEALEMAMANAMPGDLIMIFYEKYDKVINTIRRVARMTNKKIDADSLASQKI